MLEKVFGYRLIGQEGSLYQFEVGEGGNGTKIWVEHNVVLPAGMQGYGTVHHVAFRVDDREQLDLWDDHIRSFGLATSGFVERYYFQSVYTRVTPHILIELATDGPGFM